MQSEVVIVFLVSIPPANNPFPTLSSKALSSTVLPKVAKNRSEILGVLERINQAATPGLSRQCFIYDW